MTHIGPFLNIGFTIFILGVLLFAAHRGGEG